MLSPKAKTLPPRPPSESLGLTHALAPEPSFLPVQTLGGGSEGSGRRVPAPPMREAWTSVPSFGLAVTGIGELAEGRVCTHLFSLK